jgi:hypothetical protein
MEPESILFSEASRKELDAKKHESFNWLRRDARGKRPTSSTLREVKKRGMEHDSLTFAIRTNIHQLLSFFQLLSLLFRLWGWRLCGILQLWRRAAKSIGTLEKRWIDIRPRRLREFTLFFSRTGAKTIWGAVHFWIRGIRRASPLRPRRQR